MTFLEDLLPRLELDLEPLDESDMRELFREVPFDVVDFREDLEAVDFLDDFDLLDARDDVIEIVSGKVAPEVDDLRDAALEDRSS